MIIDNQKSTSKTTLLKLMLMRAWKERWTDCQWGINVKTVLTRGVSGDVYNLADCIVQQAVVGSGANTLFLSYLKHSLCAHLISYAAVLKRISKYEHFEMSHCLIALLEFLDSIFAGVTCRGKQEESLLTKAMVSLVYWLMQIYEHTIEVFSENRALTGEQQEVVEKMAHVLEKIVQSQFLLGVVYVGRFEDPDMYSILEKKCAGIDNITVASGFVPLAVCQKNMTVNDYIRKLACIDCETLEMKEFDSRNVESISYCLQPLIAIDFILSPNCDNQTYVAKFVAIQRLKGYSLSRLYYEVIRACLVCLNNVNGTSRESFVCAFTFIKVPHILRQTHFQSRLLNPNEFEDAKLDYSPEIVEAFELLLQDAPILDFVDAKCACNTIECLLNEMLKHHLVNEHYMKLIAAKRDMITAGLQKLELNTNQHSIVKFVYRAEPPLVGILKSLNADYNKMQEAMLGVLCQVLSGNSFELILSVATMEGKLKTFVSGLIKCNENSKQVPGEMGKPAMTRAALFDVTFLMLTFIVQHYGSDVVLTENSDSFFEKWVREYMIEKHKSKSPMAMVRSCDQNKVDELIVSLNSPEGLKATALKWQDICANIPGLLYQVLLAWENETLSTGEIKKFLDSLKSRFCCFSICAASWLCAYMQIVRQDELLKPMNMVQQFLTAINSEDMLQQENLKERLMLTVQIVRKMQQDFQRLPGANVKLRSMFQSQNLISQAPLEEQFEEVWNNVVERGWLPIDSTLILENLLQSCGPFWLVDKLVQQIYGCKYVRDMRKTMDIVFAIMHLDIERCTVALLSQLVPMMLLNKLQISEIIDPFSRVLAKLCVYCIIATMEAPTSPTKKRSRTALTAAGEGDELDALCPTPKLRKMGSESCDSSSSDFMLENALAVRDGPSNLKEPLQTCLQALFKTFAQYIVSDELSPKIFFMFQFLSLLVEVGKDRIKPVLKLIPNGLIQNMLKINATDDMTVGFILRLYDLNTASGRQFAMSDLCLFRNIDMRKDSIKL
ncbi:mediator of RNA polymerase II transcription subunit 24 isoform X2 [Wyeomyia smithii]|uniref:mediator of RNA polymerase II transcription subunit 24 isoform X1 n=1 Tax=Wyeomyia smithii TaxID=174621 RepID=UPI002467CC9D|nr:mediator of RNA polymerase II transcription subunit 24 isoform X1 [Wyeomyia smithii]XP_055534887.1 mediator of RNA polymerase II transcription subunit 24 isoform X1 [Wyeomyia smithii]XP_055534889.1 mediator of RNA polymerase II transcription subunit 24 isoform X2 [Wyeomyia smithii]